MAMTDRPSFEPVMPADALLRARRLFFQQGQDPADYVSPVIARSWQRCAGIAFERDVPEVSTQVSALQERRDARARLRRHALPELESLGDQLVDTACVAVLADADGVILDVSGSMDFLQRAQRLALRPGVLWSEQGRGTNAIGTALAEDHAVQVWGAEHFLEWNAALGCAAVPLHDLSGDLLGVLDISGDPQRMHPHTLGMARLAAGVIEHRLALDAPDTELLRFHSRADLLGTHREALIAVRSGVVVGANRAALSLLAVSRDQLQGQDIDAVLQGLPSMGASHAALLHDPQGRHFSAAWSRRRPSTFMPGTPLASPPAVAAPAFPATNRRGEAIVADAAAQRALARALRVSQAGMNVLVQGESGCGKEVFARALHASGSRAGAPFVAVNCAALPETLIEAELFGYEDGAFTGAARKGRKGRIREADGGVLFLDEIGDMPLPLQARLLRVLQEREVQPLGGGAAVAVDFALVCATHRSLSAMVESGHFRADLYWRLQDHVVELPPLRSHPGKAELIDAVLKAELEPLGAALEARARAALHAYPWPGNWRQLRACVRALAALADPGQRLQLDDLPPEVRAAALATGEPQRPEGSAPAAAPATQALATLTRTAVEQAVQAHGGNMSAAARALGVHRSTLHRWLAAGSTGPR